MNNETTLFIEIEGNDDKIKEEYKEPATPKHSVTPVSNSPFSKSFNTPIKKTKSRIQTPKNNEKQSFSMPPRSDDKFFVCINNK